jgi:rSAM/selenodomain-associated transferase 1
MHRASDSVAVAVLAKAPIAGLAKTRLIPAIGAHAAACLQERLTEQTVATACAARIGPVTLWATPNPAHPLFRALAAQYPLSLATQPGGDLGGRMLAAFESVDGLAIVIGTDCAALTAGHLQDAAQALIGGQDIVVIPAEDGGYVLIGSRLPQPSLFRNMAWGTETVMKETRARLSRQALKVRELAPLWDIDRAGDLDRAEREGFNLFG